MHHTAEDRQLLFKRLLEIIAALREPERGCPWDRAQTHESLKPYVIEEAYELNEAIDHARDKIHEELGDVLLQVLLHSQIADDREAFDIGDVMKTLAAKLVHRHPHVFGETVATSPEEVVDKWQQLKRDNEGRGALEGIPRALPALMRAEKMGDRAAHGGFEWPDTDALAGQARDELHELQSLIEGGEARAAEKLGGLLFTLAQLARTLGLSAEELLQSASMKFAERFAALERLAGKPLKEVPREDLERLAQRLKTDDA